MTNLSAPQDTSIALLLRKSPQKVWLTVFHKSVDAGDNHTSVGGEVEFKRKKRRETHEQAMRRELMEELGIAVPTIPSAEDAVHLYKLNMQPVLGIGSDGQTKRYNPFLVLLHDPQYVITPNPQYVRPDSLAQHPLSRFEEYEGTPFFTPNKYTLLQSMVEHVRWNYGEMLQELRAA